MTEKVVLPKKLYESELTNEEMTKEFLKLYQSQTYKKGVRDALRIHGIHYDWLEDDAE